jgi:hypothetical protein
VRKGKPSPGSNARSGIKAGEKEKPRRSPPEPRDLDNRRPRSTLCEDRTSGAPPKSAPHFGAPVVSPAPRPRGSPGLTIPTRRDPPPRGPKAVPRRTPPRFAEDSHAVPNEVLIGRTDRDIRLLAVVEDGRPEVAHEGHACRRSFALHDPGFPRGSGCPPARDRRAGTRSMWSPS